MSIPEGNCLRNCYSKMNWFTPSLLRAFEDTGYAHTEEALEAHRNKRGYQTPDLNLNIE